MAKNNLLGKCRPPGFRLYLQSVRYFIEYLEFWNISDEIYLVYKLKLIFALHSYLLANLVRVYIH